MEGLDESSLFPQKLASETLQKARKRCVPIYNSESDVKFNILYHMAEVILLKSDFE